MSGDRYRGDESGSGADAAASSGDFAALAPDLTKRIETILGAVQREADKMLDQAREEAQRQVEFSRRQADGLVADRQRRLAELSDRLIVKTEAVVANLDETEAIRASFGRLLAALAKAADHLTEELAAAGPPLAPSAPLSPEPPPVDALSSFDSIPAATAPSSPPPPTTPPVASFPAPDGLFTSTAAPEAPPPPAPPGPSGDWRQAAIQMAAAGSTRGQVEAHLRGFLQVSDPTAILDQVFGAGTGAEARVPWAIAPPGTAWPQNSSGG